MDRFELGSFQIRSIPMSDLFQLCDVSASDQSTTCTSVRPVERASVQPFTVFDLCMCQICSCVRPVQMYDLCLCTTFQRHSTPLICKSKDDCSKLVGDSTLNFIVLPPSEMMYRYKSRLVHQRNIDSLQTMHSKSIYVAVDFATYSYFEKTW